MILVCLLRDVNKLLLSGFQLIPRPYISQLFYFDHSLKVKRWSLLYTSRDQSGDSWSPPDPQESARAAAGVTIDEPAAGWVPESGYPAIGSTLA